MKVCNDYHLLINLYIDGELDADEARAVEAHLSVCPACRRYCDEICMVNRAIQDVGIPSNLHSRIMAAVSAEQTAAEKVVSFLEAGKAAQAVQKKRRPARRWIGTVAAMLAIACVGVFGMEGGLTSIFSGVDHARNDSAIMETELTDGAVRYENAKATAADTGEDTAESVPEAEAPQQNESLPIRIEETMTGWFTDTADHVTVLDCGMPMALTDPETEEAPVDSTEGQKGEDNENTPGLTDDDLAELDALLGEAADGYGFCLVAAGPGAQLPVIFAEQADATDPGYILVITVRNDPSVREQIRTSLTESSFEVYAEAYDARFATDPEAEEGLVIIELTR